MKELLSGVIAPGVGDCGNPKQLNLGLGKAQMQGVGGIIPLLEQKKNFLKALISCSGQFFNKIKLGEKVDRTGLEPVTSALSKQRSEPTELTVR